MNCPICGSTLKGHITNKGALFLVCTKWPQCRVSGTPELLVRLEKVSGEVQHQTHERPDPVLLEPDPVPLGSFIERFAKLRIYQSRFNAAKTAEDREAVRKQALDAVGKR